MSEGWVWGVFEDVLVSVKCRLAHAYRYDLNNHKLPYPICTLHPDASSQCIVNSCCLVLL